MACVSHRSRIRLMTTRFFGMYVIKARKCKPAQAINAVVCCSVHACPCKNEPNWTKQDLLPMVIYFPASTALFQNIKTLQHISYYYIVYSALHINTPKVYKGQEYEYHVAHLWRVKNTLAQLLVGLESTQNLMDRQTKGWMVWQQHPPTLDTAACFDFRIEYILTP